MAESYLSSPVEMGAGIAVYPEAIKRHLSYVVAATASCPDLHPRKRRQI
jgi:hypothetical protein